MFEQQIVGFEPGKGFSLVNADIVVHPAAEGIELAASSLAKDLAKVTGVPSRTPTAGPSPGASTCIIAGVAGSPLIDKLGIDTGRVRGKRESWMTTVVDRPEGYSNGLIIVGSDMRGTIFGIYSLSEQIGVSPWHWWADVPPKRHEYICARPVTTLNGEPSVKYRGIFINDEKPGLSSFVQEKFGPKFDSNFYHYVFELLLRLKANFLWPAMWRGHPHAESFFVDDPKNQALADTYGIVIGTSHHEPCQRAADEWNSTQPDGSWDWDRNRDKVTRYFEEGIQRAKPYESYVTMGMRGDGDAPVNGRDPQKILREVLETQRSIIKKTHGSEDGVLQLMALYNEVGVIYDAGLKVPESCTLLFSDDNFGSLRRLPNHDERKRSGGSGIYYHFQYTGFPRCYRWMNSISLGKTWHQLQLAYSRGANQLWVFNVGDLKPIEVPMSFAFDLAWDIKSVGAESQSFTNYFRHLATREFGNRHAAGIAKAWHDFDRLLAIIRQDHLEPSTYSILKYAEADGILERWGILEKDAALINSQLDEEQKSAFFQLVLHPIKASHLCTRLRVTQSRNRLYAAQRRNSTNTLFFKCLALFDEDHELTRAYDQLSGGKWRHIMRQPHYGYLPNGGQPFRNMIEGLCYVQAREDSNPSIGQMGIAVEGTEGVHPGHTNEDSDRTHPSRKWLEPGVTMPFITPYGPQDRYFEVTHLGTKAFDWTAKPQHDWIKLSLHRGRMEPSDEDTRVTVSIGWSSVPPGFDDMTVIEVRADLDGNEKVRLVVRNSQVPDDFSGIVETSGHVAIDAGNFVTAPYTHLPMLGRPLAGSVTLPLDLQLGSADELPFLRYPVYIFTTRDRVDLEMQFAVTLDTDPKRRMEFDVRWDDGETVRRPLTEPDPGNSNGLPRDWPRAAMDCVWRKHHDLGPVKAGKHVLEVRLRDVNMILEKLVLDLGDLRPTYLGPPQSEYVQSDTDVGARDILRVQLAMETPADNRGEV